MSNRHDVTKVGDFYIGGLLGNSLSFFGSSWNFVSDDIKNVDTHHVSFSSKKQVIEINYCQKAFDKLIWNEK